MPCFMPLDVFQCLLVQVCGDLNSVCTLLLCGSSRALMTLDWFTVLFRSTIPLYFSVCSFLLRFESLVLELQLKVLLHSLRE